MSAVFKKEFSQLFHSMIGYVCLAVFAAITGYYFFTLNLLAASGDVRGYFSSVANVIMLILPMLTMRSFSEEKKMRTDQLLIASPVSSFAIVMGKALATACFFIVCLLPCAAHMLWLFRFCNADLRLIACCAIGLLLTASAFLSIGLYLSAVTENQVIACVVTYGVLLAFLARRLCQHLCFHRLASAVSVCRFAAQPIQPLRHGHSHLFGCDLRPVSLLSVPVFVCQRL